MSIVKQVFNFIGHYGTSVYEAGRPDRIDEGSRRMHVEVLRDDDQQFHDR